MTKDSASCRGKIVNCKEVTNKTTACGSETDVYTEIAELQKHDTLSKKEIQALQHRLTSMEGMSTRILQLNDNPTSREQAVKLSQLTSLREENRALLAQIE